MLALKFAKKRLDAVLQEIKRLKDSDFPHPHSSEVLDNIKSIIFTRKEALQQAELEKSSADLILGYCAESLTLLDYVHPLLGNILRSTDINSSFELYHPILNIAKRVIDKDIKLILSSEWEYSPFVLNEIPELPHVAMLGLPASEANNPLLVPLAGHELGHTAWLNNKCELAYSDLLKESIYNTIESDWGSYSDFFNEIRNGITIQELKNDIGANNLISRYHIIAKKQAQETFCDFMGVRLFGESYFYAFAYLCSPGDQSENLGPYPAISIRVKNLIKAACFFEISDFIPENYTASFETNPQPKDTKPSPLQLMSKTVEFALESVVTPLLEKIKSLVDSANLTSRSESDVQKCLTCYKLLVPAKEINFFGDIINAGWLAYNDDTLWADKNIKDKQGVLYDLILKSFEVFEIEAILRSKN